MFNFGLLLSLLVISVNAHVALWDKGMFGLNYPGQATDSVQNYNTNDAVIPLRSDAKLTVDKWFGHGRLAYPPKSGDFMVLPAGGVYKGELACNRADSKLRDPRRTDAQPNFACDGEGALHVVNNLFNSTKAANTTWFGGTALAIAYTSDWKNVKPSDMTVISVNTVSPWFRNTDYAIPAGLPACPAGGCLCTWNWIHRANNGEGYPYEIYNNMYRCSIHNPGTGKVVGKPAPAKLCAGNAGACVKGPKQPNYVWMASGNNQAWTEEPPTYNSRYGFAEGAQNDIFVTAAASAASSTTTSRPASTSTTTSRPATSTSAAAAGTGATRTVTVTVSAATTRTVTVSACPTKAKRHLGHGGGHGGEGAKRMSPPMGMNRLRAHPRDFADTA